MDHPYSITRQDSQGTVERARSRYFGDAQVFIRAMIGNEINPCIWRIKNEESGRLLRRLRYINGEVVDEL